MEFKIQKGKYFWFMNVSLFIVFGYIGGVAVGVHNLRDAVDMTLLMLVPIALIYFSKISKLVVKEENLVYVQGMKEQQFVYANIIEIKRKSLKGPTFVYGPERIRFIYLKNGKQRPYEIAPVNVDKCFEQIQKMMSFTD